MLPARRIRKAHQPRSAETASAAIILEAAGFFDGDDAQDPLHACERLNSRAPEFAFDHATIHD